MKIQLSILSDSLHTCGVITGFLCYAKEAGAEMKISDERSLHPMRDSVLAVRADGKMLVFDLMDGYRYEEPHKIDRLFFEADYIFKRSFSETKNQNFSAEIREKIHPLGLNYFVTCPENPLTKRGKSLQQRIKTAKLTDSYTTDFEAPVLRETRKPKILFLTRLWNPCAADAEGNEVLAEERRYINQVRTDTVRLLKKEFGNAFFGGVYTDAFSAQYCPELLVDKWISLKRAYLHRMKRSDICINTMGLHGSIGWKTAEYVAASRAIVSEKFCYKASGDFAEGKNYLSFATPEECVQRVGILMENPEKRLAMSAENHRYYERYLRPDAQIKRVLEQVFGEGNV